MRANSASSRRAQRGPRPAGFMRTTAESTFGGGVKAPGGTLKRAAIAKRYCSITERRP